MRKKVPLEVKMEALKLLQTGMSVQSVSKQLKISYGDLQTWNLIYEKEGEKGLAAYPKNMCTDAIKTKIICAYDKKSVPLHSLSAKYSVPYSSVARCISTYRRRKPLRHPCLKHGTPQFRFPLSHDLMGRPFEVSLFY